MFARSSLVRFTRTHFGKGKTFSTSAVKNGHGHGVGMYRLDAPPVTYGARIKLINVMQTYVWFHVFYNFWYHCEIMLGHPQYEMPNPALWSDEELGIPPDDYDEEV